MAEERGESHDSVALVYRLARAAYRDQLAQRDQQRTRCETLLAFAGIVWFSLDTTPRFRKLADEYLLWSRRDAELQILGNTVDVIRRNERTLQRADSLFGLAVLLLFLGTLLIGARVALLLL